MWSFLNLFRGFRLWNRVEDRADININVRLNHDITFSSPDDPNSSCDTDTDTSNGTSETEPIYGSGGTVGDDLIDENPPSPPTLNSSSQLTETTDVDLNSESPRLEITCTDDAYETPIRKIFVDFQGFRDNRNNFIVKELAAVEVTIENPQNPRVKKLMWTTIKSPFGLGSLNRQQHAQYRFLSHNYHGLSWEEGTLSATAAFKHLRRLICCDNSSNDNIHVFSKGDEKTAFIANRILKMHVTEYGGKSMKYMQLPFDTPDCPYHSKYGISYVCSLNNVYKLAHDHISVISNDPEVK